MWLIGMAVNTIVSPGMARTDLFGYVSEGKDPGLFKLIQVWIGLHKSCWLAAIGSKNDMRHMQHVSPVCHPQKASERESSHSSMPREPSCDF